MVNKGFANAFKESRLLRSPQHPHPSLTKLAKAGKVENLMTLKQACSPEYQGAQGAFKDSMIH
jgi:hypothetical protein